MYDARNRESSAGGVTQTYTPKGDVLTGGLVHDTFGRVTADGNARYVYDGADRPVARELANGASTDRHTFHAGSTTMTSDGVARYGNSPGGTAATAWRGGTAALLLGADRHGDVVTQPAASTGDRTSSRAYDPYGAPTATLNDGGTAEGSSWAGNLGYQFDWTDPATSRVNMGARWYTPPQPPSPPETPTACRSKPMLIPTGTPTRRPTRPGAAGVRT